VRKSLYGRRVWRLILLICIGINDLGDCHYDIVAPLLRRIPVDQLLEIESNSPVRVYAAYDLVSS